VIIGSKKRVENLMSKEYYKLSKKEKLDVHTNSNVYFIDWKKDFGIINTYFQDNFGIYDLKKNDPDDFAVVKTVAYIHNNQILSLAVIYNIKETELEIGAVSTAPRHRKNGYSTAVVSKAAEYILSQNKTVSITTNEDNTAMQRVAKKVGFEKYAN
jgi:RimJ/RimL family protein N-acetyltransferase